MNTATVPAITGSVSTGTLRLEDLLPAFIDALEQIEPDAEETLRLRGVVNHLDRRGEMDTDEAHETLFELFDALDGAMPEGWRFGAHEGDGADFGVWEYDPLD